MIRLTNKFEFITPKTKKKKVVKIAQDTKFIYI